MASLQPQFRPTGSGDRLGYEQDFAAVQRQNRELSAQVATLAAEVAALKNALSQSASSGAGAVRAGAGASGQLGFQSVTGDNLAPQAVTSDKIASTGVTAGTYAPPASITVNAQGQVTAIS